MEEETLKSKDLYPWLEPNDLRRKLTDRQTIDSKMDMQQFCLSKEQEDVYNLLVKYREAFHLRDEIGTCLNIEVDLQVIDKSSFFIGPFYVKQEDKPMIEKETQGLALLGILKRHITIFVSN